MWSTSPDVMQKIADVPRSAGELASIAPTKGLPSMVSGGCIVRPPGFPRLELAVPHDVAAGIETLVEHALGDTVAGIEHGLLDLPTPDSLDVDTVCGPSYSQLVKTGLDDTTAKGIARWGAAVFFIGNRLAVARERMAWHADDKRAGSDRRNSSATTVASMSSQSTIGTWRDRISGRIISGSDGTT